MKKQLSNLLTRGAIPGLMVCALAFPPDIFGQATQQDHIVSSQALQQRLEASAAARQRDIETLNSFLSSPVTQQAMQETHVSPVQIRTAIPTLSDQELSSLATRAADAQMKFTAGAFGNHELIVIAVAILVIILVIVAIR
jgi:CHASE3 domain sensor protein